jgi:predicted alpha-1,2-mannosidase
MRTQFILVIITLIVIPFLTGCEGRRKNQEYVSDFISYVDPFIGTGGHGHTYPGATLPFGMVQLSPDNGKSGWDWSSGYHYSSDTIIGFSHTHLSGTGIGDLLDILVLPTTKTVPFSKSIDIGPDINQYYSRFSHDTEKASPGYYSVVLEDCGVTAEFTATKRAGFHRYTPENSDTITFFIDLKHSVNTDSVTLSHLKYMSDSLVTGFRYSTGWAKDQKVFFAMRFSQPICDFRLYSPDSLILGDTSSIQARRVTGAFKFSTPGNTGLLVKTGISSVSEENALTNLFNEIPDWNFNRVKNQASEIWNRELGKIRVRSDNQEQLRIFYTAMYHSMLAPNIYNDSLMNNIFEYRSPNNEIKSGKNFVNYYTFSLWDTYRAAHPLFTILHPSRTKDFIRAMLTHYHDTGLLPVWSLWGNETNTMIGYHAIPVIADAFLKGLLTDMDSDTIYQSLISSAFQEIREMPLYRKYGYIPADSLSNTVSKTLEYAYDDWCIAQVAKAMNKSRDYNLFMTRAGYYVNLFDSSRLFMRARLGNGDWKEPFDPFDTRYSNDYTEGNAWQYTWYVPHDIDNLIRMMGGEQVFNAKLDSLFTITSNMGEEAVLDVSGTIGQYVHGNEPSHHIAYLYNYSGQPWKTQEKVRQIMDAMYSDQPDGLAGNEDCGQMSAWYIFSALGFYPVNPANGKYDLGIPLFPQLEIQLDQQNRLTIIAKNHSPENRYVKSVSLNGNKLNDLFITHDQIMEGGILEFELSGEPISNN